MVQEGESRTSTGPHQQEDRKVVTSTGPHQQEDGGERCHEETPLCRRPGPGANGKQELQETLEEWNGLFTRHRLKIRLAKTEVLHIGHQRQEPGHQAGGEETDPGRQFRVSRRGSVRRREDRERGTPKSTGWSKRVESS